MAAVGFCINIEVIHPMRWLGIMRDGPVSLESCAHAMRDDGVAVADRTVPSEMKL